MADLSGTRVESLGELAEVRQGHPGASCDHFRDGRCLLADLHADPSLCLHCLADATGLFRARFAAQKARRELAERVRAGGLTFPCDRFRLDADERFCLECTRNPALQQVLAGGAAKRRREPCIRRREQVGEVEVKCCGGRTKLLPTYACDERPNDHVAEPDCLRCAKYKQPHPSLSLGERIGVREGESVGSCVSWESLWQCHKGKTALVLACGPSVLLPGEDPGPDTVDPRQVEADVVVSTNWAWKWYEDIIDYQVSYDPTPCLGWRPAHIRLLTPVRPRATRQVLERAHVYGFFPSCDYGDIARGKPLPCSRNSGYAAIAFAAYAGASLIKVLGMDFNPRVAADGQAERMHFYHEGKMDVDRRVRSFGRQKDRVQADLKKLLAAVRATGATVENLSPRSELDWGTA